jgi:agmatinase
MKWKLLAQDLLCPPGHGVYTVNTASERKKELEDILYPGSIDPRQSWIESLAATPADAVCLFGLCSDTGGGILRGANWGPLFLRLSLKEDYPQLKYHDLGDARVIPHLLHDKYLNEETLSSCREALYNNAKSPLPVSPLSITETFLEQFFLESPHARFFGLGGDHSVSYAFVAPFLKAKKQQGKKIGLLHFDAHTDLIVKRLGIDLCFGSWCTPIIPLLDSPDLLVQVGIRSSAKERNHWEETFGVRQYWSQTIKDRGAQVVIDEIIEHYQKQGIDELYISFDIDAIDSEYASATGTPEPDGLTPDQAALMIRAITKKFSCTGADMVEVAPFLQTSPGKTEPLSTLRVASSLSALMIEAMREPR